MAKKSDPTKGAVRGWYYDPLENWWYHRHIKGVWPFRKKRFIETNRSGVCHKCGKQLPEDIKNLIKEN